LNSEEFSPKIFTPPEWIGANPRQALTKVDFPDPFAPSIATTEDVSILKVTLSKAIRPG
jgi:hypothetical protein